MNAQIPLARLVMPPPSQHTHTAHAPLLLLVVVFLRVSACVRWQHAISPEPLACKCKLEFYDRLWGIHMCVALWPPAAAAAAVRVDFMSYESGMRTLFCSAHECVHGVSVCVRERPFHQHAAHVHCTHTMIT